MLPGSDASEAVEILARLRGVTPESQSFSAGIATWDAQETGERLVARADTALYQAKSSGRARSVIADADPVAVGTPPEAPTPVTATPSESV